MSTPHSPDASIAGGDGYDADTQALIDSVNIAWEAMPGSERLSSYFGLSYAAWLTLPRVLMQAMPDDWQKDMAKLLERMDEEFPSWCKDSLFVTAKRGGRFAPLDELLCNYRHPDRAKIDALRATPAPSTNEAPR